MSKSGRCAVASSSASCPSLAGTTLDPALVNFSQTTCRMCDSSSATRIRFCSAMIQPHPTFIRGLITQAQLEPETASLTHVTFHEDPPFVHRLHNVLHERQAQPCALGHVGVA